MIELSKYLYAIVVRKNVVAPKSYLELLMLPSMSDEKLTSTGCHSNWSSVQSVCNTLKLNGLSFGNDFMIVDDKNGVLRDENYNITSCDWLDYDTTRSTCKAKQ